MIQTFCTAISSPLTHHLPNWVSDGEFNAHPISTLFSTTGLNNILYLAQLELLLGKSLAGEFDASSLHLVQF